MQVKFTFRETPPDRLVAEAELLFEEGPLLGMKLVGFALWKSPEGGIYVTFPSRAYGSGEDRRYFDLLRSVEGAMGPVKALKQYIITEFHKQTKS